MSVITLYRSLHTLIVWIVHCQETGKAPGKLFGIYLWFLHMVSAGAGKEPGRATSCKFCGAQYHVLNSTFVHEEQWPYLPTLGQKPHFVVPGHVEKISCDSRRISKGAAIFKIIFLIKYILVSKRNGVSAIMVPVFPTYSPFVSIRWFSLDLT